MVYVYNPNTWEAEAPESRSSRTARASQWVTGHAGLHSKFQISSMSRKKENKQEAFKAALYKPLYISRSKQMQTGTEVVKQGLN